MKRLFVLFLAGLYFPLLAQSTSYWQQKVDYRISVQLDTNRHELHANLDLEYTNASPDTLTYIWFHIWPQAYSDRKTEFARRKNEQGSDDFYFASESERGGMDSLHFRSLGKDLRTELHPEWKDVIRVELNHPLLPGSSCKISTPFRTRIPTTFSRLGREGKAYQISQWYPKPAVYDKDGWHPMPYLDQGEFYSEFGRFEVNITVPSGYVVASTGKCSTASEMNLLNRLAAGGKPEAESSTRSFTYIQDSVHDFAWFADPDFQICSREIELTSGRKIIARSFYKPEHSDIWKYGCEFLARSVQWYSSKVGEYPYDYVSAVDGALKAGGGMEYPMITVIGEVNDTSALEEVILHEVGHNWFYGILASQERKLPWMDEGINSYYEHRYLKTQKLSASDTSGLTKGKVSFNGLNLNLDLDNVSELMELAWIHAARQGNILAPGCASEKFSALGYGIIVYAYTSQLMEYLEAYLGTEVFDKAMQIYYQRWSFRHPTPKDLQAVLEEVSRKKTDWFFEGLIKAGNTPDFSIQRLRKQKKELILKNHGQYPAPVKISWLQNDREVYSVWTEPFRGKLKLSNFYTGEFIRIHLNADQVIPEINSKNNAVLNRTFLPKIRPLHLAVLPVGERRNTFPVFVFPVAGVNSTDGLMAGVWLSNQVLPSPRFRISIMPMYGFQSDDITGSMYLKKDFILPASILRKIQFSFTQDAYAGMQRARPQLILFKRKVDFGRSPDVEIRAAWNMVWVQNEVLEYLPNRYNVGEIMAGAGRKYKVQSWNIQSGLRWNPNHFLLWENEFSFKQKYLKKSAVKLRAYTGYFLNREEVGQAFRAGLSGSTDYLMQQVFLDRAGRSGTVNAIVNQTDGQMGGFGAYSPLSTDQWMYALNLKTDVPYMPFMLFADVGRIAHTAGIAWDAGMGMSLIPDVWEIYFPFLGSMYSQNTVDFKEYGRQIRFMVKLNLLTPDRLAERLK